MPRGVGKQGGKRWRLKRSDEGDKKPAAKLILEATAEKISRPVKSAIVALARRRAAGHLRRP